MSERRRPVTLEERLTPCECCGHPLSQRHHLFEFSKWGESSRTIQLCANCHEIYHLIDAQWDSSHAGNIIAALWEKRGANDPILLFLANLSLHTFWQRRAILLRMRQHGFEVSQWQRQFALDYGNDQFGFTDDEFDENGFLKETVIFGADNVDPADVTAL